MTDPAEFPTQDLLLSAYLTNAGHELLEVRRNGGDRADFIFADSPDLRLRVKTYYARRAVVEPQAFAHQIRNLRGVARLGYSSQRERERSDAIQPLGT